MRVSRLEHTADKGFHFLLADFTFTQINSVATPIGEVNLVDGLADGLSVVEQKNLRFYFVHDSSGAGIGPAHFVCDMISAIVGVGLS